ncbi:MAG: efflux RND transporter periplasmic adaptor subunit, partial [Pseudomonadota bacterium]
MNRYVLFFSLAAVLAVLFTGVSIAKDGEAQASASSPALVPEEQIFVVSRAASPSSAVLGGTVLPHKMVKLLAQIPGEVEFIAGEEGDTFESGNRLVSLDISALLAKRRAAVAGLSSAQAGVRNAMVQYRREIVSPNAQSDNMLGGMPSMFGMFSDPMRSMMGQGDPGYERHSDLYGQGVRIQTAHDQVAQAQAGIRELDENIENATSTAPFDGVIVKKMIEVGDVVQPGMPLVVFADTSKMEVQVEVPTRLVSSLREGDVVNAHLDRGAEPVVAAVSRVFPMANTGGHTTTVKFALPDDSGARAGMYAEVVVIDPGKKGTELLAIPETAIIWRGSLPAVYAVSEDRTQLKMRAIRLGPSIGDMAGVLSGLEEGDAIL